MECIKTKFVDEKAALFYIDKLKRTSTRINVPKRAYLCPKCLSYHLTHRDLYPVEMPPGHKEQIETLTAAIQKRNKRQLALENDVKELKIKLNEANNMITHLKQKQCQK